MAGHQIVDEAVRDTYGERSAKSWAVPLAGKFESIGLCATPNKPLRQTFSIPLIYLS